MSDNTQLTTLSNGLRIVTIPMGGVQSAVVGTWVGVGSRYENKAQNGITHFLEHMFFKGTATRNTRQISGTIESLGGIINANTGKDRTAYFTKVLGTHLVEGFNVVADILRNSTFPQKEMDKERLVVIEEIKRSADDNDQLLSEHFLGKCFAGQPLGRPILGPPQVIRDLSRQDLVNYVDRHYTPERMVVVAAGAVDHNQLVDLSNSAYGDMKRAPRIIRPRAAKYTGGDVRIERDMAQLQIYTTFKGVGGSHADMAAHVLLAQVLGGGMSSPLFQKIREERGLVYGVSPVNYNVKDAGTFGVYAGLSPERVTEYLDVLTETLQTIMEKTTAQDLEKAKNRINAGNAFALESAYAQANLAATSLLDAGKLSTADARVARLGKVTLEDLKRAHAEIFSTTPTIAAMGKLGHLESYDTFAARFATKPPAVNPVPAP